jgi:hypothetical protein
MQAQGPCTPAKQATTASSFPSALALSSAAMIAAVSFSCGCTSTPPPAQSWLVKAPQMWVWVINSLVGAWRTKHLPVPEQQAAIGTLQGLSRGCASHAERAAAAQGRRRVRMGAQRHPGGLVRAAPVQRGCQLLHRRCIGGGWIRWQQLQRGAVQARAGQRSGGRLVLALPLLALRPRLRPYRAR